MESNTIVYTNCGTDGVECMSKTNYILYNVYIELSL